MAGDHGSIAQEMAGKRLKFKMPTIGRGRPAGAVAVPFQVRFTGTV
jgi:hypothetical protein